MMVGLTWGGVLEYKRNKIQVTPPSFDAYWWRDAARTWNWWTSEIFRLSVMMGVYVIINWNVVWAMLCERLDECQIWCVCSTYLGWCAHQVSAVWNDLLGSSESQQSAMYACPNINLYLRQIYYLERLSFYLPHFFIKLAVWILVGKLTSQATRSTTPRPLIYTGESTTALRTVWFGSLHTWTTYRCGTNR